MTKKGKIVGGIGLLALASYGIYKCYRLYQNTVEYILTTSKNAELSIKNQIKEVGIDPEKIKSDEIDENTFIKSLLLGIAFNKDVENPAKVIDVARWLDGEKGISHVALRSGEKPKLDVYFEIPNWIEGSYGTPNLGDYVKGISSNINAINQKNNFRFSEKDLGLYAVFTFTNADDEVITSYWKINPEVYNVDNFMDSEKGHDGLKRFYEAAQTGKLSEEDKKRLKQYLKNEVTVPYGGDDPNVLVDIRIQEIVPMMKYSYTVNTGNERGITWTEAITLLKDIVEKVSISRGNSVVKYDCIVFHSKNKNEMSDLASYYYLPDPDVDEVDETEIEY